MGEEKAITKKLVIIFIIFVLLFSSMGNTLLAIATSSEFEVITNGFLRKDEIEFKAYFVNEDGKQVAEKIANVNEKVSLNIEINPQVEGYLKEGNLRAVTSNESDLNFKILSIKEVNESLSDVENNDQISKDETEIVEENIVEEVTNEVVATENNVSENSQTNEVVNEISSNIENEVKNEITNEVVNEITNEVTNNKVTNNEVINNVLIEDVITSNAGQDITSLTNTISEEVVSANKVNLNNGEVFIDEDQVIEEKFQEKANDENNDILKYTSDNKIVSDNEVSILNVTNDTKLVLELEFLPGANLNVESLLQNIKFQLSGTFINSDLEEVKIGKEESLNLGWNYTKDISLTSEYTKFSPFVVGDTKGTIVENKISLNRNVEENYYLPLKSTLINVEVPEVNGKRPIAIDISATKLLATNGEDIGKITFSQDNWNYDSNSGIISIKVNNELDGKANYSFGSDEYVIIYRYEDYVDENLNLKNKVMVECEEYSAKTNFKLSKEIDNTEEILVDIGELITYDVVTNEEKVNKAFVNANYNSDISYYESQFTNNISLNILTSDLIDELKVNVTKDVYKDINNTEYEATGIAYKSIKFNYSEITSLLSDGGEVVITNTNNEIIGVLNKELLTSEESAIINLNDISGIYVYVNDVSHNGVLSFEVTKAIKKCNYDKETFNKFKTINSKVSAEVKYSKLEDAFKLKEKDCTKYFEDSTTIASLLMGQQTLSSMYTNNNVEFKIELNNNNINSDLYINPTFEIVFPKNVKEVSVQSINLLYENGLKIKDFRTYTESDIVKMRIELEGTQTQFVDSEYTNGTNILLSLNIVLDEYTSAKEDEIKLYYYNEGATNYTSQTKWSINKVIPKSILKETNGFDAVVFDYSTPDGLVSVNTIKNYDGQLSEVKSVKQGEKMANVELGGSAKIATMELLALNNTGNTCTDVVLLGRIPFAGNKDVITNDDLQTNIDTTITGLINTNSTNANITEIYYSTNAEATNSLDNIGNGWTQTPKDISQVKSYLIVIKGTMQAGSILRFSYDFNIPANLPYESKIVGSFGAFYNNVSDVAIVYESNIADKVGLQTEAGPKLEATLNVDVGDNTEVLSGKILKYTAKVKNTGSVAATNVTVSFPKPNYANFVYKDVGQYGDYGYIGLYDSEQNLIIESILPGEEKEVECFVRTFNKPTLDEYSDGVDENGYYIIEIVDENGTEEKKYITEMPDIIINMKAKVMSDIIAESIETNEINNKLEQANFDFKTNVDYDRELKEGMETNFSLVLTNTSRKALDNIIVKFELGDIYSYKKALLNESEENVIYNSEENIIYYNVGHLEANDKVYLNNTLITNQLDVATKTEVYSFKVSSDNINEESIKINQTFVRAFLSAKDVTDTISNTINENETIQISTQITNVGLDNCDEGILKVSLADQVNVEKIVNDKGVLLPSVIENGMIIINIPVLLIDESTIIDIIFKAKNLSGNENSKITVNRVVENGSQTAINISDYEYEILNNKKTQEEIDEENRLQHETNNDNTNKNEINNDNTNNNDEIKNDNQNVVNEENKDLTTNTVENSNSTDNSIIDTNNKENELENTTDVDSNNIKDDIEETIANYGIYGEVWNDINKDGIKDSNESKLSGITVELLKNGVMMKVTSTDSNGTYSFRNLEKDNYEVIFKYDSNKYVATVYKTSKANSTNDSDAFEVTPGESATNLLSITNDNINNIDLGLKEKDTFDFEIEKYLVSSEIITNKKVKSANYDNAKIAKIEMRSKDLNNSIVKLQYKIIVENKGLVNGYIGKVLDQIPEGMQFNEKDNAGWYLGNDGILYNETLKDSEIKTNEQKELSLVLTKEMNSENTGIVSNKVVLDDITSSRADLKEDISNNSSTQEVLITVSTGGNISIIIFILIIGLLLIDIYIHRDKIKIFSMAKYKNSVNKKIKVKKIYK